MIVPSTQGENETLSLDTWLRMREAASVDAIWRVVKGLSCLLKDLHLDGLFVEDLTASTVEIKMNSVSFFDTYLFYFIMQNVLFTINMRKGPWMI